MEYWDELSGAERVVFSNLPSYNESIVFCSPISIKYSLTKLLNNVVKAYVNQLNH